MPSFWRLSAAALIVAVVFIVGGACLYELVPPYVRSRIEEELVLSSPTCSMFESFANASSKVDIYMRFYVFHCENPYDVEHRGAAPVLVERGPYVFLVSRYKDLVNLSWHANATVSYAYHQVYQFRADLTGPALHETDNVTTLNLGVIGALYKTRNDGPDIRWLLKDLAQNQSVFVNITVMQLLFGYNNSFLETLPSWLIPNPEVKLFTNNDPASFSTFTAVYTGGGAAAGLPVPPPHARGMLTMWEGLTTLPYWGDRFGNMLNGTDGTALFPGLTTETAPFILVPNLFRSVQLSFSSHQTYEDVKLLRFMLSPHIMLNATANPNNAAFFMDQTGFLGMPPIKNDPVSFSKPFFLDASRVFVNVSLTSVSGQPVVNAADDRDAYDTFLDAEPYTGLLFQLHKRLQLNTFVERWYNVSGPPLSPTWFPLLWGDESVDLPETFVDQFKTEVMLPLDVSFYGGITLMSCGSLLGAVALILMARRVMFVGGPSATNNVVAPGEGSPFLLSTNPEDAGRTKHA